jgi:20S proteasome alpha/beta subunit
MNFKHGTTTLGFKFDGGIILAGNYEYYFYLNYSLE